MSLLNCQWRLLVVLSPALIWPLSACSHSGVSEGAPAVSVVPAARAIDVDLRNNVTLTAEFEPYYEVDVMAKEAGYIRHMFVDIGNPCRRNDGYCGRTLGNGTMGAGRQRPDKRVRENG